MGKEMEAAWWRYLRNIVFFGKASGRALRLDSSSSWSASSDLFFNPRVIEKGTRPVLYDDSSVFCIHV